MIYVSRTSPCYIDINTFIQYGGQTGSYTTAQLNAALVQAELMVEKYLGTYLCSTTVTGSYPWPTQTYDWRMRLGVNYLQNVDLVTPQHEYYCDQTLVDGQGYAFIKHAETGVVDLRLNYWPSCSCWAGYGRLYMVRIVYTAGFPYQGDPMMLTALTQLGNWFLTYLFNPDGFESEAGGGVQSWSSLDYSESRAKLYDTIFGNSPTANAIARLLKVHKRKPAMALGR